MYIYLDTDGYVYGYGSDYEENSYKIDQIPSEVDQYLGAYKFNTETFEFEADENKKAWLDQLKVKEKQLDQLTVWFDWYDRQYIQWQRAQRLGLSFNQDMQALDEEAVINAQKILEYRAFLAMPYTPNEVEG